MNHRKYGQIIFNNEQLQNCDFNLEGTGYIWERVRKEHFVVASVGRKYFLLFLITANLVKNLHTSSIDFKYQIYN